MAKPNFKEKAVALRKEGLTYREIMKQIPVAKSTLSEWLHSVGLAKHQKQKLTERKLAAAKRGAEAKHLNRLDKMQDIIHSAKSDIGLVTPRELWLIGIMLYWAEGSKEKIYTSGKQVRFTNTDPNMIKVFLFWLKETCNIDIPDITFDITIHELHRHRTLEILEFWADIIGCDSGILQHIYYKRGNPKTLRKNVGESYHGTLRINVKSSSSLNRKIAGWTQGVVESIR